MSDTKNNECCRVGCFPYNDGLAITGQVLAIVAFLCSLPFYPSAPIGLIALVLQQVIWCCRQNKCGMIATIVLSGVAGLVSLGTAIWLTVIDEGWGWGLLIILAIPIYISAVLWFVSMGLTICFVTSGRHARFEEQWKRSLAENGVDVEMTASPPNEVDVEMAASPPKEVDVEMAASPPKENQSSCNQSKQDSD